MTVSVYARLINGDTSVLTAFTNARVFWDRFLAANANASEEELATALGREQISFELAVDSKNHDRAFAKEIMPATAFASLYDEVRGFDQNEELAKRLARAFQRAGVSIEVHSYAREAQEAFSIYPNE